MNFIMLGDISIVFVTAIAAFLMVFLMFAVMAWFILVPWFKAFTSGTGISLFDVIGMRMRMNPPHLLIDALITCRKRDPDVGIRDIELCYMDNKHKIMNAYQLAEIMSNTKRPISS